MQDSGDMGNETYLGKHDPEVDGFGQPGFGVIHKHLGGRDARFSGSFQIFLK